LATKECYLSRRARSKKRNILADTRIVGLISSVYNDGILNHFGSERPLNISKVAEHMAVDRNTMTAVNDRSENLGSPQRPWPLVHPFDN